MSSLIRAIAPADSLEMARIIREVMPSFGASGPGFAILDPEVDDMFSAYQLPRSAYLVVELAGRLVGGAGVAPLVGGDEHTCELRKMYFLPDARGLGLGRAMLERCLAEATRLRFRRVYLETLTAMNAAKALYEKSGFVRRTSALGSTGHFGCNEWYEKWLDERAM